MAKCAPLLLIVWFLATPLWAQTSIVNPSSPASTDVNNPLGTVAKPRKTIPNPLPACGTVQMVGNYTKAHTGATRLRGGSPSCWTTIISATGTIVTGYMEIGNGVNLTFQGLRWFHAGPAIIAPNTNIIIRNYEIAGIPSQCTGTSVVTFDGVSVNRGIVYYQGTIHDNGDVHAAFDQDCHGIVINGRAEDVYVVESHLYNNSGDGVQVNGGSLRAINRVWLVRNEVDHNKQSGLWTKQASDVIISGNTCHDHRPSNSSVGACLGGQYGPERVWFVNNYIHDSDYGIQLASDIGDGHDGQYVFVVGNVLTHIHDSIGNWNPNTGWQNAAISIIGSRNRYVMENSAFDVDTALASPAESGLIHVFDNAFQGVRGDGYHVFIESPTVAAAGMGMANYFAPSYRLRVGETTTETPCCTVDPDTGNAVVFDIGWIDAAAANFHLQPTAPVIDQGLMHLTGVWEYFASLYGQSMAQDIFGTPRPVGERPDVGATEFQP